MKLTSITITTFYLSIHGLLSALITLGLMGGAGLGEQPYHKAFSAFAVSLVFFTLALLQKNKWIRIASALLFACLAIFFINGATGLNILTISIPVFELIPLAIVIKEQVGNRPQECNL